jgi:hypothetical protein
VTRVSTLPHLNTVFVSSASAVFWDACKLYCVAAYIAYSWNIESERYFFGLLKLITVQVTKFIVRTFRTKSRSYFISKLFILKYM